MKKHTLERIRILIADADAEIASVTEQNLRTFGFQQIHQVHNGEQALEYMKDHPVDLLITEWMMPIMDGVELVHRIRYGRSSPNRTVPIIMLTGKGEQPDVATARDVGITEFVIKPFTTQTLYSRIEQLVDNPRAFVLSTNFIGPDRRRRAAAAPDERRTVKPLMVHPNAENQGELTGSRPKIIHPDQQLKRNMGFSGALSTIITPDILDKAQKAIDAMGETSVQWIKNDFTRLESGLSALESDPVTALETMKEAALSIKSRAGTFGYLLASDIARQLYLFLLADFSADKPSHKTVVIKHLEAMKIIFATGLKNREGMGQELITELQRLIEKQR